MIKHPALRVASIGTIAKKAPDVLADLLSDLEAFAKLLPFKVDDFEVTGSAARGCWQFHSDLDINLATGDRWQESKALIRENPDKWSDALRFLHSLYLEWGIRIEVSLESPAIKDVPQKQCCRLREGRWYNKTEGVAPRVDYNQTTKAWFTRPAKPLIRPPRYSFSHTDDEGNVLINQDHYPKDEVAKWAKVYGPDFLRIGDTPDTAYLK
jgi:predicted nucleotidyltransferase